MNADERRWDADKIRIDCQRIRHFFQALDLVDHSPNPGPSGVHPRSLIQTEQRDGASVYLELRNYLQ